MRSQFSYPRIQAERVEFKENNSKEIFVEDDEVAWDRLFINEAHTSNLTSTLPSSLNT